MLGKFKKIDPVVWTIAAVVLGLIFAFIFGEDMAVVEPIGNMFINLIKMCCVPLIMCSLITTVANMRDMKKMGRVGGKMMIAYVVSCCIAGAIGLIIAFGTNIGSNVVLTDTAVETTEAFTALDVILNMIPSNIFSSMANFDMLPCVLFSILFGIALALAGDEAKPAVAFFTACNKGVYKLIEMIMKIAPIGIFCLIAAGIGSSSGEMAAALAFLVVLCFVGAIILLVMYVLVTWYTTKVPMKVLIPAYIRIITTAFSTASSAATLPLTIDTTIHEFDCDEDVANFMLPIGCTINMNGFVCLLCIIAVLAANCYNMPLTVGQCITAVAVATLSGIGMPGVPNGGPVFYIMLFTALGFPSNSTLIGLIQGVGTLCDRANTTCNVCGDIACTSVVSASERKRAAKAEQ